MHNSTGFKSNHTKVAIVPMPPTNPALDSCDDNLCFNGGFCDPLSLKCRCRGHFIGRYCLQTSCDLHPCQNGGLCSLTSDGYLCSCPQGFGGPQCERRLMPCETEPCVNGISIEDKTRKDGYRYQCHLWWIGSLFISTTTKKQAAQRKRSCIMRPATSSLCVWKSFCI